MKKLNLDSLLSVLFFLVLCSGFSFSQTLAGKVILKEEADKLFGPVVEYIKMPVSQFQSLLNESGDYMMFRFEGPDLYIFNSNRSVLFSSGAYREFTAADELKVYSTSVVKELLSKGQSDLIIIEKRQSVMSVTDGAYTMEYSTICPPDCPIKP